MSKGVKKISEASLQSSCIKWFRGKYPKLWNILFAVPNGGGRNPVEGANLKRQGVVMGVADLILLIPKKGVGGVLCLELKVGYNKQSEFQKNFEKIATSFGNEYVIVRTLEEFSNVVDKYIKENLIK